MDLATSVDALASSATVSVDVALTADLYPDCALAAVDVLLMVVPSKMHGDNRTIFTISATIIKFQCQRYIYI